MTTGIALSGGGLKCIAHIGALKALEELNVKFDYISGTSSGAIIATLYAMGYTIDEMKEGMKEYYHIFTKLDKKPIVKAGTTFMMYGEARIGGLADGRKVEDFIQNMAKLKGHKNMDDIDKNLAVVTVDTISTKECIFLSNEIIKKQENIDYLYNAPIGKAVRASCAFPGIFTTCDYEKYNFVDGGTKDNLPVQVLKDMGADRTISLSFKFDDYTPKNNLLAIILRVCDIFSQKDVEKAKALADIDVEIDAQGTSLLDVDDFEKCYKSGYDAVMRNNLLQNNL